MKKHCEDLMRTDKKELHPKTKERMLAMLDIVETDGTISAVARLFHKAYSSIKSWVIRFEKFGITGLAKS